MYGFLATPSTNLSYVAVEIPKSANELLRALREQANLSVREAARRAGISHTRLGDLESDPGKLGMNLSTIEGLARAYDVPIGLISDIALGKISQLERDTQEEVKQEAPQSEATLALRRRLRELGLSQTVLGRRIKKSQGWISQYLFGDTDVTIKRLWHNDNYLFTQIAKALEWSDAEFMENTGINLTVHQPSIIATDTAFLDRFGDSAALTIRLPLYGSVAAGIEGFEYNREAEEHIDYDRRELPNGVDPKTLYVVKANGNSMFAEGMTRPVPDGSMLLVEAKARPAPGQVVVAYIPELAIGVVKQYIETEHDVLLKSYRQGAAAFWASQYPEMRIEGVVRRVTYEMW